MNKIELLTCALEYIELHLRENIKTEDVAHYCYCSKSVLEKVFRYVNHISVHDYVVRRKMMLAARDIVAERDKSILDIALAYGYSTNESFSRAFKKVWNCNPSQFQCDGRFSELFPRLLPPINQEENEMSGRKNVDISELYDLFENRKNCYFVCGDIKHLIPINEISRKAGDLAILESMNRMGKEAGEEDILFRIGGDEFVILTNSTDVNYAEDLCERIRAYNGNTFVYEEKEIPLSLYVSAVKFEGTHIRYNELYEQLHSAIMEEKN